MSFQTTEPLLKHLLRKIQVGDLQIPEFQRGWVWGDDQIKALLTSISLSYPIGAIMLLQAGNVPYKPRLFEGVSLSNTPAAKTLVLDGQQRLTSLYLALQSGQPVQTRDEKRKPVSRIYFLDMQQYVSSGNDRDEAVISVSETMKLTSDFGRETNLDISTPELQFKTRLFPVSLFFDDEGFMRWVTGFGAYHSYDAEAMQFIQRFQNDVWLRFQQFKIPAIELSQDTPREAVCQVFEQVNTGGVTLTIFELMTATFAASEFNLRNSWDSCRSRMTARHKVLEAVEGNNFLTTITLLASYQNHLRNQSPVSCKRGDVLHLNLSDYRHLEKPIETGFMKAAEILAEEKIFDAASLPYVTQLIPLAAICAHLGEKISQHTVKQKILRWFWSGVFGELYGGSNESKIALDLIEVIAWIDGGHEPRTIKNSNFVPTRLLSLQSKGSAAYKGLSALMMKHGSYDLISGTPIDINAYYNNAVDFHHIFPKAWCRANQIPQEIWNSVINKTPLSSSTNQFLRGESPGKYLTRVEKTKRINPETLNGFLASHLISADIIRSDNFDAFIRHRGSALLNLIESATGKTISGRDSEETKTAFGDTLSLDQSPSAKQG